MPEYIRTVTFAVRGVIGGRQISIEVWDSQKSTYTDEFSDFVDEAIADLR